MPPESLIMYAVAALFAAGGTWMLLKLRRATDARRIYAYRMVGIMALAGGVVLAMSATAMWQWSVEG